MKKLILLILLGGCLQSATAQKFGYIDADFILKQMPAYQKAQSDVSEASTKWQDDLTQKWDKIRTKETEYEKEKILLTDEMKKEREEEIEKLKKEAMEIQKKIFGFQGLFHTRQQELMKPALDELNKAVQTIARKNRLQFVFSNTEGLTIIYAEPTHDYTEEVLEELGLTEEEENPEKK
jgi:outer membrane protein